MSRNPPLAVGATVELREVVRPFGAWDLEGPSIPAGTRGTVERLVPELRSAIVRFPGHLPLRVTTALLKNVDDAQPPPQTGG